MMNKSLIEWCDFTWNPVTGCQHGCLYCYAAKQANRFSGNVMINKTSEQLRKALKRMCWKTTMYLSPLLREAQEKRIDEWLGEEADPEWRE